MAEVAIAPGNQRLLGTTYGSKVSTSSAADDESLQWAVRSFSLDSAEVTHVIACTCPSGNKDCKPPDQWPSAMSRQYPDPIGQRISAESTASPDTGTANDFRYRLTNCNNWTTPKGARLGIVCTVSLQNTANVDRPFSLPRRKTMLVDSKGNQHEFEVRSFSENRPWFRPGETQILSIYFGPIKYMGLEPLTLVVAGLTFDRLPNENETIPIEKLTPMDLRFVGIKIQDLK